MKELEEAVLQARCFVPGVRWDDGMTEGAARIERMIAEKQIAIVLEAAAKEIEALGDEILEFWERPGGPPGNGYRKTKAADFAAFVRNLASREGEERG